MNLKSTVIFNYVNGGEYCNDIHFKA